MDVETLRIINAMTTLIALFLSIFLLAFGYRALRDAYRTERKFVAISLLGVGAVFFVNALVLSYVYLIIFTSNDRDLVNGLANVEILISNLITIFTSMIMLGIYSDKL